MFDVSNAFPAFDIVGLLDTFDGRRTWLGQDFRGFYGIDSIGAFL